MLNGQYGSENKTKNKITGSPYSKEVATMSIHYFSMIG